MDPSQISSSIHVRRQIRSAESIQLHPASETDCSEDGRYQHSKFWLALLRLEYTSRPTSTDRKDI